MYVLYICRLGFLVDCLSHAAIVGFMGGAAVVIGLQQLKGLLGLTHFTIKTDIVSVLEVTFKSVHNSVRTVFTPGPLYSHFYFPGMYNN